MTLAAKSVRRPNAKTPNRAYADGSCESSDSSRASRLRSIKIAADFVNVEAHHAGDMSAINGRDDAFCERQSANFTGGQDHAGCGGNVPR